MRVAEFACLVVMSVVTTVAAAQDRTPVQDARPLLIAAIDAADGLSLIHI